MQILSLYGAWMEEGTGKERIRMFGIGKLNAAVVGTGFMAARMSAVLNASGTARP